MKKIFFILTVSSLGVLTACGEKTTQESAAAVQQNDETPAEKPVANQEMSIEISGMTCEKGCGSSIRKELKSTGGVTDVSYDFEDGRETNVAKIKFDDSKVTEDDLILAITTLDGHKYTIGEHSVKSIR